MAVVPRFAAMVDVGTAALGGRVPLSDARNIIWPRDPDLGSESQGSAPADLPRHAADSAGDGPSGIRSRSRRFSYPRCDEPKCVWIGRGQPLLCHPAEEREDAIRLRSAGTGDLRECCISSRWLLTMLVSDPPSGPANQHLDSQGDVSELCHSERRSREEPADKLGRRTPRIQCSNRRPGIG
jgi:hypothetical protein